MQRLLHLLRALPGMRSVQLTLGLVMLSLCVLLVADFSGLRGNSEESRHEARVATAELLAMRLSVLADRAGAAAINAAIDAFVAREETVEAAELHDTAGRGYETFGRAAATHGPPGYDRESVVRVPILENGEIRGELWVTFVSTNTLREDAAYFGFVTAGLLLTFVAYLGRVLLQIDPSRAIPDRVGSAFNMLVEGVIVVDLKLRVLMLNEAASKMIGKNASRLIGRRIDELPWTHETDETSPWGQVLANGLPISDVPVRLAIPDGATASASYTVNCSLIRDDSNQPNGVMITLADLSAIERKNRELSGILKKLRRSQESITRKNRELEALASQDPLTGLMNRRALMAEMERQFEFAKTRGEPLAVLMIDIDHFKSVNDSLGHAVGDEVICAVANTLCGQGRSSDSVGRVGGEEFVALLSGADIRAATETAERIRASVERLGSDVTVPVDQLSASLGLAMYDNDVASIEQMLDRADQALYRAKNAGRNCVVTFHSSWEGVPTQSVPDETSGSGIETQPLPISSPREDELVALLESQSRDLDELRNFDPDSGLPRTDVFLERVSTGLHDAAEDGSMLGVLSLALRDTEKLATTLGHQRFETLRKEFTARLRDGLRQADLVGEITSGHRVSHGGGDSFCVLLENLDDAAGALAVMTRMRRALSTPFMIDDVRLHAGMSIGAAFYPEDGTSVNRLLELAVAARREAAQQSDKVAFRFACDALSSSARETLEMESDLYQAVEMQQFSVHYQPKFDLFTRRICGVEALARWEHPDKGWISPVEFIPVAESNGLIKELSAYVQQVAFEQVARWREQGYGDLMLSINVSATQLRDPDLVHDLLAMIQHSGLPTSLIEVELTETAVIESPQRARIALGQLRDAGLSVSMDDFGTGYTSLALLAELPLDTVKIDRSFVDAMTDSERSRAVVRSIIDMAHALELSVVGEGVETEAQLQMLADFGCNEVQGYLISRPQDASGLTEFLSRAIAAIAPANSA